MILLHRLRTQNFKQLTDLNLGFPERGTVLIEGLNEAGKSSLFEAVFFALYGRPLSRDQDYKIGNLKTYSAEEMRVDLDFSVDGRPFTISRRVVGNQKATLTCPRVDGLRETFTGNRPIEQRLKEELRLTSEALLNTCFVEQKGLERLESLQADQRRETVNELLNLRVLSQLDGEYRLTRDDHGAVTNQRRRVEIATLDMALPELRAAELSAARCLIYSRILEIEQQLLHLEEQIGGVQARRSKIEERRGEIASLLQQAERIKGQIRAIEGDLFHRVRAWNQVLLLCAAAAEEVRKLELLEASLPERESQHLAWEELGRGLEDLERLETYLARQQDDLRTAEERLARFDEVQHQWDTAEAERQKIHAAVEAKEAEVTHADTALRERIEQNHRAERLTLLLRHTMACDQAEGNTAGLARQLEAARATAGRLDEHRLRLRDLEELSERLRRRDEDLRRLERVRSELAAAKQERQSLRERQTRSEALEADLARLEASRTAVENEELDTREQLQKAEARVALAAWATAAERCAESDPTTGRLANLQERQSEALSRLEVCKITAGKATNRLRLAVTAVAIGLFLGLGGFAIQQIATVGVVGMLLLLAGLVWAFSTGKQLALARADQTSLQKACDGLEGERRVVEQDARTVAAEHDRRRLDEAECRRVLLQLNVEVPTTPAEGQKILASLPNTPVAAARQAFEAARLQAGNFRTELELARRSLDTERSYRGAEPDALQMRIADLTADQDRLQQVEREAAELPHKLEEFGILDLAELKSVLDEARRKVATSNAAEESLRDLENRREENAHIAAAELVEARKLADETGLAGDGPAAWEAAAQRERLKYQEAAAALPEAALQARLEQARQTDSLLKQQLIRLETAQEGRRTELDREPRSTLAEVRTSLQDAAAATEATLGALGEVRPTLSRTALPVQSADLRPRLAVLRGDLERDQAEVLTLPEKRSAWERHAAEAEGEAVEVATAWQNVLAEVVPAEPGAALERLPKMLESLRDEIITLNESGLRGEDETLQKERASLDGQHAVWVHDREQKKRGTEALLNELGVELDVVIDALPGRFPELSATGERNSSGWSAELERRREATRANRADRRAKAELVSLGDAPLDLTMEQDALAQTERTLAVKRRAGEIVMQTRQSIVNRVMPLTMQNMRQILPLLTEGRYQDAEWDEQNNVISVYDMRAASFQRKRVFSGGARDQISLSLRLAFALATLPGEHNVRPGWLFLDEPLSSFDHARTQALVDLLTRGLVRRQFAQIFLISHSQSFDPDRFDYRIRMDGGQVVETNLPASA